MEGRGKRMASERKEKEGKGSDLKEGRRKRRERKGRERPLPRDGSTRGEITLRPVTSGCPSHSPPSVERGKEVLRLASPVASFPSGSELRLGSLQAKVVYG